MIEIMLKIAKFEILQLTFNVMIREHVESQYLLWGTLESPDI